MNFADTKYLLAYIIPSLALLCAFNPQSYYYLVPLVGYILIPILEQIIPPNNYNQADLEDQSRSENKFFDVLLYLNFPLIYIILGVGIYNLVNVTLTSTQVLLCLLSFGICMSTAGLNVAHELGHRQNPVDQIISRLMLATSMYMHFNIEHNLGHHKYVATDKDPASAKLNEWVYSFYFRSIIGQYLSAWHIENQIVKSKTGSHLHYSNRMIQFHLFQAILIFAIIYFYGWYGLSCFLITALISVLHLETINYIEHYGLSRKKLANGRYEPVEPRHSWNSDHVVGRIFLYELTRHSDHHYKSSRKFQTLRSLEEGPNLLLGYPGSIMLSLIPPLWINLMNKRLKNIQN